jgi:dUTP pyrophosphatase
MKVNDNELVFAKVKEGATIPTKRLEDAAYDIYACFEEDYFVIEPFTTKLIPTGIASAFTPKWVALLRERGSNGSKGIAQRAGVIDSGYRGEWFVPLTNTNRVPVVIAKEGVKLPLIYKNCIRYPYTKGIAQVLMVEVPVLDVREVDYDDLLKIKSERGTGCLGSSNK